MRQSRGGFEAGLERCPVLDDGPGHVDASSRGDDGGLVVALPLASLAIVEGLAVVISEQADGELVEDPLEAFIATAGFVDETGLTSRRNIGAMLAPDASACVERKRERSSASARSCAASATPMQSRPELWRPVKLLQPENRNAI
jgi:hypothetical protein